MIASFAVTIISVFRAQIERDSILRLPHGQRIVKMTEANTEFVGQVWLAATP
jgi:hypothetical protein